MGALANVGYTVSDKTVGNIPKRNGLAPAPERKKTTPWKEFIRTHQYLLVATDFFMTERPKIALLSEKPLNQAESQPFLPEVRIKRECGTMGTLHNSIRARENWTDSV